MGLPTRQLAGWRKSTWNRWLVSYLQPEAAHPTEPPGSEERPSKEKTNASENGTASVAESGVHETAHGSAAATPDSAPPSTETLRRLESMPVFRGPAGRAFERMFEMLGALEDGLEAIGHRLALSSAREKSRASRMNDLLSQNIGLAERVLDEQTRIRKLIASLDTRVADVERHLGVATPARESYHPGSLRPGRLDSPIRETVHPPAVEQVPGRPNGGEAWSGDPLGSLDDAEAGVMSGDVADFSLSTLLAMFELERRTGRLTVTTPGGAFGEFDLAEGSVTSARLSGEVRDPVDVLRTALTWASGRFSFRQRPVPQFDEAPRSTGSLLLEATHRNDEGARP